MWAGFGQFSYVFKFGERNWKENSHPRYVRTIERWRQQPSTEIRAVDLLDGARQLFEAAAFTYTTLQTGLIPASSFSEMLFSFVYNRLIKKSFDPPATTFLLGFDSAPIRAEKRSTTWPGGPRTGRGWPPT